MLPSLQIPESVCRVGFNLSRLAQTPDFSWARPCLDISETDIFSPIEYGFTDLYPIDKLHCWPIRWASRNLECEMKNWGTAEGV